jgi:CubicO group peptidase (beta-lactamase class C family)
MKHAVVLLALLVVVALARGAAASSSTALPRSAPEAQGVSSTALLEFLTAAEEKIDALHSFMLVRRGQVVAEGWWAPYAAELPHALFSLSKSFTSTAVGLAIAEGKFTVEDPILKFFPDEAPPNPSANLRAMRVRDLLTMSAGHHTEDLRGFPYNDEQSAVRKFLALPVAHKPGTFFVYNTPATFMLSAIVQKTTGQPVLDYLRPRLFEPLGIENPAWERNKQGISMGGFGLSVRTEDIARFGQLYLQRGQWRGRQLVPAAWVDNATSRWMSNGSNPESDWEQGYGFQFWRCRYGVYRGDGANGQFCLVFPELDAVVAITAGTRNMQGVLNVVWDKLLPALKNSGTLPVNPSAEKALREKLASLSLKMPVPIETPALAKTIAGQRFVFPKNPQAIEWLSLAPHSSSRGSMELTSSVGGVTQRWQVLPGAWNRGELLSDGQTAPIALSGAWTAADTFTLDLAFTHLPNTARYTHTFAEDRVTLTAVQNLGPPPGEPIVGRREAAAPATAASP